ncbi:PepSY domain-containing protein [Dechloromonas agitata]|mgnify:CR=1 FL=1|uniref:PepSY domain-containing protein n=1 Tax=Dechloromonas agitata TaxID=73030 RepID=UPI0004B319CD|nr:PepSY domain-containing protein [Dechloromonas agitata]
MQPLTITALLATVFFSMSSHAQDVRSANTDKARWLSIPEVHARLESAGYRNIEKIERESGSYEVKATDQAGRRIKLYVHPQTGEVIDQRQRDIKRDKYDGGYAKKQSAQFC